MTYRPNLLQWLIIWPTALLSAHFWLQLRLRNFWPGTPDGDWGISPYLRESMYRYPERLAFVVLIFGVLLVWQSAGWHKPKGATKEKP